MSCGAFPLARLWVVLVRPAGCGLVHRFLLRGLLAPKELYTQGYRDVKPFGPHASLPGLSRRAGGLQGRTLAWYVPNRPRRGRNAYGAAWRLGCRPWSLSHLSFVDYATLIFRVVMLPDFPGIRGDFYLCPTLLALGVGGPSWSIGRSIGPLCPDCTGERAYALFLGFSGLPLLGAGLPLGHGGGFGETDGTGYVAPLGNHCF